MRYPLSFMREGIFNMVPRWLQKGLAEAKLVMDKIGLKEPPRLNLPPHPPTLVTILSVIQPGDYVFSFVVIQDPMLNHFRNPTSFQVMASKNGGDYAVAGTQDDDATLTTIIATTNAGGSGIWRYKIRALNSAGFNDSTPVELTW